MDRKCWPSIHPQLPSHLVTPSLCLHENQQPAAVHYLLQKLNQPENKQNNVCISIYDPEVLKLRNKKDSVRNRDNSNKYQETPYAQLEVTTTRRKRFLL
jgi:hypothetical protein